MENQDILTAHMDVIQNKISSVKNVDTTDHRVILHLDLDCFYAQVETVRLAIPPTEPLAVQQWVRTSSEKTKRIVSHALGKGFSYRGELCRKSM